MNRLTRRSLLRGTGAVGTLAVGAAVMAACGATPTPQVVKEVVTQVVEREITKIVEGTPQVVIETVVVKETVESVITATPGAQQAAAGKVPVRWGVWSSGAWLELENQIATAYNEAQDAAVLAVEASPWQQYWDKLQISLAAGTAPDLIWMSGAMFLNLVEKGGLLDLTDLIASTGFDISKYYTQPRIFDWQGKSYGMPWSMGVQVLYANKTAFEEAGVALPPDDWNNPAWTWAEFLETAKALTKGTERYGVEMDNGMEFYWGNFIWSNGGDVLSADEKHTALDLPESIEALKFAVDLIHADKVAPTPGDPNVFQAGAPRPFALGKVAMDLGNNAYIPDYVVQIKDFEWGLYPLPKAPKDGASPAPSFNGNPICVASKTQVANEAFDTLAFLSGDEGMGMVAAGKLTMPALMSAAEGDPYITEPPTGMKRLAEGVQYAEDLRFSKYWLEWVTKMGSALDKAFIGESSIEDAIKVAVTECDAVLNQ
ncbi:MAG: ABC transporter substrate-binding protein [Anaerolineae bacterium]